MVRFLLSTWLILVCYAAIAEEKQEPASRSAPAVSFKQNDDGLEIRIDDKSIAEFVWRDENILRPYFQHLRTLSGIQVTRNHPPSKGKDLEDHATMHPGLWLAFGDLNGADFWRNKAIVKHDGLVGDLHGGPGRGSFEVRNVYEADGQVICTEDCQISIELCSQAYLLKWRSTFRSDKVALAFGDQEEMGLGLRVATPLAVVNKGRIEDSEGRQDEKQVWGKQADWCSYHGIVGRQNVGVVLMPHPKNFRRCWFHARDYGLLVANPFGRNAFTGEEKSSIRVGQGAEFQLSFGVLVYDTAEDTAFDIGAVYRAYIKE